MAYPPSSSEPSMSPSPHYGYSMIHPNQPLTPLLSNAASYSPYARPRVREPHTSVYMMLTIRQTRNVSAKNVRDV